MTTKMIIEMAEREHGPFHGEEYFSAYEDFGEEEPGILVERVIFLSHPCLPPMDIIDDEYEDLLFDDEDNLPYDADFIDDPFFLYRMRFPRGEFLLEEPFDIVDF